MHFWLYCMNCARKYVKDEVNSINKGAFHLFGLEMLIFRQSYCREIYYFMLYLIKGVLYEL